MPSLAPTDYVIIACYLGLSLVLGLMMSRRASKSLDHYFLGGRTVPWYLLGVMGMANWFDLTGTMIITSFLYMLGPRGLFVEFRGGAVLILVFMLAFTGKWHRRSGCMTGAEWGIYRFGDNRVSQALRLVSAAIAVLTSIMVLAYLVRGATLFLGMFFPFPAHYTTLALIIVTTIYTISAGFYGVVITDLIQGVIIIAACVIVSIMAWHHVPDAGHLAAVAQNVTGNPEWTSSLPSWHTPMPEGYEAYSGLLVLAAFYLARQIIGGLGTGAEQRYFGARSDRDCGLQSFQQALMISLRWPLMVSFAVLGIYFVASHYPDPTVVRHAAEIVHAHFPQTTAAYWHDLTGAIINHPERYPADLVAGLQATLGEDWRRLLPLVGVHGTINPEQILPAVLLNVIPTGLKGLIVVAMFAAMMSCKNGLVNSACSFFVKDIYQHFLRPRATNRELLGASYLATLVIVLAGFLIGIATTSINDLWGWISMGLLSGQLAPGLLRLYWWRCNAWGCIGGMILGGVAAIAQRLVAPGMSEPYQFLFAGGLSFFGTITLSLLTAPTDRNVLRNFYRTTRPFGWWKPLRDELPREQRELIARENRTDILTVPFGMLWQVTLFLLPMQLIIKEYSSFRHTLPLFLVGALGMYFFWWRPLNARSKLATPLPPEPDPSPTK